MAEYKFKFEHERISASGKQQRGINYHVTYSQAERSKKSYESKGFKCTVIERCCESECSEGLF